MGEKIKKLKKIRIHREGNDTLIWSFIVIAAVALLLWRLDVKVWFWLFLIVFGTASSSIFSAVRFAIFRRKTPRELSWHLPTERSLSSRKSKKRSISTTDD